MGKKLVEKGLMAAGVTLTPGLNIIYYTWRAADILLTVKEVYQELAAEGADETS